MRYELKTANDAFFLENRFTVVGRDAGCDIQVKSKSLSRRHARFICDGETVMLEDLDSRNGTFVNEKRIETIVKITAGDSIRFGDVICRIGDIMSAPGSTEIHIKQEIADRMVGRVIAATPKRTPRPLILVLLPRLVMIAIAAAAAFGAWRYVRHNRDLQQARRELGQAWNLLSRTGEEDLGDVENIEELRKLRSELDDMSQSVQSADSRLAGTYSDADEVLDRIFDRRQAVEARIAELEADSGLQQRARNIAEGVENRDMHAHEAAGEILKVMDEASGGEIERLFKEEGKEMPGRSQADGADQADKQH